MRSLKAKSSRSRSTRALKKRGSSSWRVETTFRRFWSNVFIKIMVMGGMIFLGCGALWWAEYPQRLGNMISHSLISATAQVGFRLTDVMVEGRHNASIEKILSVVNMRRGDPLFSCDPYHIKKQLEEISWIRQATVKRQLPGIIFIQLNERQPVALWQHRQHHYLVDEQGVIIRSNNLQEFNKLPLIVGEDAPVHAPSILQLLEKFPELRPKITALVRVGGRRWDLHLGKTLQVKLPEIKIQEALERLMVLIKEKKINTTDVSLIDLRVQSQMVVRLSPGAAVRLKGKGKET